MSETIKAVTIPVATLQALEIIQGIDPDGFMENGILIGDGKLMSISKWVCLCGRNTDIPQSSADGKEKYWILPLNVVRDAIKGKRFIVVQFRDDGSAAANGLELDKLPIKLHFLFEDKHPEQPSQFNIQLPILALMHRAAKKQDLSFAHYKMVDDGRYLCWWVNNPNWYGVFMGHRGEDRVSWEERQAILDEMAGKEPLF